MLGFIYLPPRSWFVYFQGHRSQQFEIGCIIPGREIPKWLEKVNICDASVTPRWYSNMRPVTIKKVKIQLPGSGSGCDEWRRIVLCVVFLPTDLHHRYRHIIVMSGGEYVSDYGLGDYAGTWPVFTSVYGKVESHHLWLHSVSKHNFRLPKTPGRSIDKKGFHQVELEIETEGLEVEKIGFRVV